MRLKMVRSILALVFASLVLAAVAAPAGATFPGANGRIAFSQGDVIPGGDALGNGAHSDVYSITPAGTGLTRLTHVPANRAAAGPDWSPDGRRIAYSSNVSGDFRLWVMNADGSGQHAITTERGVDAIQPSWSPDGGTLVFSRCPKPFGFAAYCDIDRIAATGGRTTKLIGGNWLNTHPGYSPDGRRLVFSSDRGGLRSAIWVAGAGGRGARRLTPARLEAFWPDFAPDGQRIVFADNCCIPHSNLWTVRPDGRGLRRLTSVRRPLDAAFPSYSPDGREIALFYTARCRNSPCRDFSITGAGGSGLRRVATGIADTFLLDWGTAR